MIGALWRGLTGALRALFGTVVGLLLVATLTLNLSLVMVPAVFNAVAGVVWSAVSVVSSATATQRATRATTNAALRADADDLAQARARVASVDAENRRLSSERGQAVSRAARVEQELDRTRTRLASTETELETTRARAATAEAENRRLTVDQRRAQTQLATAQADTRAARSQIAAVEAENTRLRASASASDARLEAMRAQRVRAQGDARVITGRMQTRSVRMVTRNTSAAVVEAIPFIGGVAVVATLAWDVYDTCAQIADLQALQATLNLEDTPPSEVERQWCGLSFEELFSRLAGTASPAELACASARVRTQSLDPPECSDFQLELRGYGDPLDDYPSAPVLLPDYSYD